MGGAKVTAALRYEGVVRQFDSSRPIGPVTFSVDPGTCFGLVGANGAGKSTLMRIALGLDAPDDGRVEVLGEPVVPGTPHARVTGMIEEPPFFPWLNASENLRAAFPTRPDIRSDIPSVLQRVGLPDVGRRPVRKFSQGMRQRLGIARVLLCNADLLVLDEPTNGLDPDGIRWLRSLIKDEISNGRAVLLSSHMLHEVQRSASDYLMLEQGSVVAQGSVADIAKFSSLEDIYFDHIAGNV